MPPFFRASWGDTGGNIKKGVKPKSLTPYLVDRPHRKRKLLKEFEDWQKEQSIKS
jgi:hypothetical protein